MFEYVLPAAFVNVGYAKKLVADIPEEKMCLQPAPGMNHAAWQLGHLAFVFDSMIKVFSVKGTMSAEWYELFKAGSQPHSDRSKYPAKDALLREYEQNFRRLVDAVASAAPETFDREFPNPKLRTMLPTIGVAMVHVLTTHQGIHLGQLSAWRRALGMPSVL